MYIMCIYVCMYACMRLAVPLCVMEFLESIELFMIGFSI